MASLVTPCCTESACPAPTDDKLRISIIETAGKIGITLKPKQLEAIQAFCSGKDVFISLPTGYGKSMIYGLLPLVYNKIEG